MTSVLSKGELTPSFAVASSYWAAKTSSLTQSDRGSTNGWSVQNTSRTFNNTRDILPSNSCRILVVGEKFHSAGITQALEKAGYTITQIESHAQALEIVGEEHSYKLACVYSSGNPTIFQFISKLHEINGIPIVAIAGPSNEGATKFLKAGASDFLCSPICHHLLRTRVASILENLQLKETIRSHSRTQSLGPPLGEVPKGLSDNELVIDELRGQIAELQKRVAWGDAEIEKKDTEITNLQHQLSAVSWRTSLLESERHKGEALSQQLNLKEKEIDDMKKIMSHAFETPLQVISRTLQQLAQGNLDQDQLRQTIAALVQSVSSSSQLYQPAITQTQFLSSLNLDDMTRQWLLYEFTTDGIPCPLSPSSPRASPILSRRPSPAQELLMQSMHQPPSISIRPQSPLKHSNDLISEHRPRSLSDPRPRSPILPPVVPFANSDARTLRSGRNIDEILKRASTTDMQAIQNYNCNVWLFDQEEIALLTWTMFEDLGLVSQFKIPQVAFFQFMETLKACYLTNPYHNYQHAFDVAQTCYLFCKTCDVHQFITKMDVFAMMVAAICHDIDHPGLNNTFQINSKSPLAILYNDLSVLENHHCARAFCILNDPKNNILSGLSTSEHKEFRRTVVSAILATDMTTHFELLTRFTTHLDARPFSIENKDDRQLIVDILLHSADISNTCKPFNISKRWSDLLLEEFLHQGDLEKQFNMPISPFMNRQSTDHVRMTLNFMDYMVAPLCASLAKLFTGMRPLLENLQINRAQWAEKTTEPPAKLKATEPEKLELSIDKPMPIKKHMSRSFTALQSGYNMLQKSAPAAQPFSQPLVTHRRQEGLAPKRLSLDVPKGTDPAKKSGITPPTIPPLSPSKLFLPKLAAVQLQSD